MRRIAPSVEYRARDKESKKSVPHSGVGRHLTNPIHGGTESHITLPAVASLQAYSTETDFSASQSPLNNDLMHRYYCANTDLP
ncbi:hypothetical protein RRG08_042402 [Elysia crispata]|uniref:Uncharacterized protein n=1 Tax=Elysia crispata TaxID=231223 RepID=A0AAE0ZC77_9GAST|nr:hypothetical protein RRG08_042402 [Elysia crispata]